MSIIRLDHYSIRTSKLEDSRKFYTDVMGFTVGFRPPFDFPGYWLYNTEPYPESNGIIHLIGIDPDNPEGLNDYLGERDPASMQGSGAIDHMAFLASNPDAMRERLKQHQLHFEERQVPSLGLLQLFFTDPSGIVIEMNYPVNDNPATSQAGKGSPA